jgi:hypothetical protein
VLFEFIPEASHLGAFEQSRPRAVCTVIEQSKIF